MLNYLSDVAIISAYSRDRSDDANKQLMFSLGEDLLRDGYPTEKGVSMRGDCFYEVYIVPIIRVRDDLKLLNDISLKLFQDLARKYEQDKFIYGGILYDTQLNILKFYTRATIYITNTDCRNRLTKKLDKMEWISIGRGYHLVLS